jgi:hypothetical protein
MIITYIFRSVKSVGTSLRKFGHKNMNVAEFLLYIQQQISVKRCYMHLFHSNTKYQN